MKDIVVVIASFHRRKLIQQTIESIKKNSIMDVQIVVVDNSRDSETPKYLKSLKDIIYFHFNETDYDYMEHILVDTEIGRAFAASPESAYWNNKMSMGKIYTKGGQLAPPSKYIYFTQNDMYFLPGWDRAMTTALGYEDLIIVAGYSGSHGSNGRDVGYDRKVQNVGLVPGSSMMFRREDWDKIGTFPDYDEDNWMSYEMRGRGKNLGLIYPYIIIHCGYTSTLVRGEETERVKTGDAATVEQMMKEYPDIIYE